MSRGKTIQIYLTDGEPTGIRTAELTTSILKTVIVPRKRVSEADKRGELRQPGLYFLFGFDDEPRVYIGKSIDCMMRISQHHSGTNKKEFWNLAVAFISRGGSFTPTHHDLLENMAIKQAKEASRFVMENSSVPKKFPASNAMKDECADHFDAIKLLLGTLGFPVFKVLNAKESDDPSLGHKNENPHPRGVGFLFPVRTGAELVGYVTTCPVHVEIIVYLLFMIRTLLIFSILFGGLSAVRSQPPTFHEDIAPIIYTNCTQCHRAGEIGPMPFTTYEEVSEYSAFISFVTSTNYMPPWTPDPAYSTLRGERFLTEAEIEMLADWHAAGAPEGDPANNPGLPDFPEGSQVGEPDLVISMPSAYVHGGDMGEQYQVYVLETGVMEETEIRAVEIRPENGAIAHHALIGYTESAVSIMEAEALDAATPEEGYESFGDYGVPVEDFLFGGWAPGVEPTVFPSTIGKKIGPNGRFLLQMHYGPTPVEETDLTSFNLFFADVPVQREVELAMMTPANLSEPFFIQPNEIKTFHGTTTVSADISLLSVMPHCHLLGQAWEVFAVSPNQADTIPLISIPEWDFNWQGIYDFPALKHIPAGYTMHAICTYDNTSENPDNPNNPPQLTSWGDLTGDEMYVLFFQFVEYLKGDENITLSTADRDTRIIYQSDVLFPAWPNPVRAGEVVTISWHLNEPAEMMLELLDVRGRVVDTWLPMQSFPRGHHQQSFVLSALPSGTYFYRLKSAGGLVRSHTIQVVN